VGEGFAAVEAAVSRPDVGAKGTSEWSARRTRVRRLSARAGIAEAEVGPAGGRRGGHRDDKLVIASSPMMAALVTAATGTIVPSLRVERVGQEVAIRHVVDKEIGPEVFKTARRRPRCGSARGFPLNR